MVFVYPELENDVQRRKLVFAWMDEYHSLRQDTIMYLIEKYNQELKDIQDNLYEVQEEKFFSESAKAVNERLDALTKFKSDGLHSSD